MPTGVATVTASSGPGIAATALVINNVQGVYLDLARNMLAFHTQNSDPTSPQQEFELEGVTTFTVSISGSTYTFTVS